MTDIKSRAMLRRLKESRKPPTTKQSGTIAEKQLVGDYGSKAIITGYNPDSDRMMGKLPNGKEIGMRPITQGSLAKGDTVFHAQGFCDGLPS